MKRIEAKNYRKTIEQAAALQNDEDALNNIYLYPQWKVNIDVEKDKRYRYEDILYRCEQSHKTQVDWTPDITPVMWTVVSLDEYPEWKQPLGAQDAYPQGAKVSHNGEHWTSDVDANTWEPGVYGWTQV